MDNEKQLKILNSCLKEKINYIVIKLSNEP